MASQYPFAVGDRISYTEFYVSVFGTVRKVVTGSTYSKVCIELDCGHDIELYHDDFDKIQVIPEEILHVPSK